MPYKVDGLGRPEGHPDFGKPAEDPSTIVPGRAYDLGGRAPAHLDYGKPLAPKPKRRVRTSAPKETLKNLVVVHNLTEAGLGHAERLGGLAAPSLAVVHKDHPFANFGDVTLVAGHDLADPKKTPIFDADVYSPRQPRAKFRTNEKAVRKFQNDLRPYLDEVTGQKFAHNPAEDKVEEEGHRGVKSDYSLNAALKLKWLREVKGHSPEIPKREKPLRFSWAGEEPMREFVRTHGSADDVEFGSEKHRKLSAAADAAMRVYADKIRAEDPEFAEDTYRRGRKHHFNDESDDPEERGLLDFNKTGSVLQDAADAGQTETDTHGFKDNIDQAVQRHGPEEFERWADAQARPLEGEPYLPKYTDSGLRKRPYDMTNVLREMTRTIKGGEGFNYGPGSARAVGAKKFTSVDQMRQHAHRLVTDEEMSKVKDEVNNKFSDIASKFAKYHPAGDRFGFMDTLVEALGESFRQGRSLRHELKASGFQDVPDHLVSELSQFGRDLVSSPTQYFEAKPQRAVGLHEFRGAAVPHDASPETLATLARHGVTDVERYQRNDPESRRRAVEAVARRNDLLLSEPDLGLEELAKADSDDYKGEHRAPGPGDAQMHDLTSAGVYPEDVYSHNAVQYYGSGEPDDHHVFGLAHRLRNRPNAAVKVYRAVPAPEPTNEERIAELTAHKAHILRTGKLPPGAYRTDLSAGGRYYGWASEEIERLSALPPSPRPPKLGINPGDWVTPNRRYAVDHGRSALGGKYKIVSKTVPARHLYTNGDSIQEWGYHPDEVKKSEELAKADRSPEFQEWFGGSKMVDPSGQPLRFYHGTRSGSQIGGLRPSTGGEFGPGIYLTADPGTAHFYAQHVAAGPDGPSIVPVHAVLRNPFRVSKTDWIKMTQRSTPRTVQARLRAKGHDGIVGVGINGHDEQVVAFEPHQVKSVHNTVPTGDPDLMKSEEPARCSLVLVTNGRGHFLFGKRRDSGLWTVPAGHADPGESPEDCARRELLEETGLEPTSLVHLRTQQNPDCVLDAFTATVDGAPTNANDPDHEIDEKGWRWIDCRSGCPANIYDHLNGPEGDANIVRAVLDLKKDEHRVWLDAGFAALAKGYPQRGDRPDPHVNYVGPDDFPGQLGYRGRSLPRAGVEVQEPESRPGHVYRGISGAEHDDIVRTGHILSNQSSCLRDGSEGTCFGEDFRTAEGYTNFGSTNPARLGRPNYVLEVKPGPEIQVDHRDGYPKAKLPIPASRITRAWRYRNRQTPEEGAWGPQGFQPLGKAEPDTGAVTSGRSTDGGGADIAKAVLDPAAGYVLHVSSDVATKKYPPSSRPYIQVVATHPEHGTVGSVVFWHGADGEMTAGDTVGMVNVDPAHRRKGLASAMYAAAERHSGRKIVPSGHQTEAGQALWAGNAKVKQFGKSEDIAKALLYRDDGVYGDYLFPDDEAAAAFAKAYRDKFEDEWKGRGRAGKPQGRRVLVRCWDESGQDDALHLAQEHGGRAADEPPEDLGDLPPDESIAKAMYHWAPIAARRDIARHGLDHRRSPDFDPRSGGVSGNFLHHTEAVARDWVPDIDRTHDLYEVDTTGLDLKPDPYDTGDASYVEHPIPPSRLRLVSGAGRIAKAELDPDLTEVESLLRHPDPAERRLALKLSTVTPRDLGQALLDPDDSVYKTAFQHPDAPLHTLAGSARDLAGEPVHHRHDDVLHDPRCTPDLVTAMHRAVQDDVDLPLRLRAARLAVVAAHPMYAYTERMENGLAKHVGHDVIASASARPDHASEHRYPTNHEVETAMPHAAAHRERFMASSQNDPTFHMTEEGGHDTDHPFAGEEGYSSKVVHPGFIVKPYHPADARGDWAHRGGWAEATSQAIHHAAGLGGSHQVSFVAPYGEHPASVAVLEQAAPLSQASKSKLSPAFVDTAWRHAAMDYLAGNEDRHGDNMMVRPDGTPLAIDHAHSFTYGPLSSGSFRDRLDLPDEVLPTVDRRARALPKEGGWAPSIGGTADPEYLESRGAEIGRWWAGVRPDVRHAMTQRLRLVNDPGLREHIRSNFEGRAGVLDRLADGHPGADWVDWTPQESVAKALPETKGYWTPFGGLDHEGMQSYTEILPIEHRDVHDVPLSNVYVMHHSINPVDPRKVDAMVRGDFPLPPADAWEKPKWAPKMWVKLKPSQKPDPAHKMAYIQDGTHRAHAARAANKPTLTVSYDSERPQGRWHRDAPGLAKALGGANHLAALPNSRIPGVDDLAGKLTSAHPAVHQPRVDRFEANLNAEGTVHDPEPHKFGGISPKRVYRHADARYMVKPFHESGFPHPAGWGEMTSQALYHAAGIGDLHQPVHVTGVGGRPDAGGYPALVVHMGDGLKTLGEDADQDSARFSKLRADPAKAEALRRIALMDTVTGMPDRHKENLMLDAEGNPLAIDHGMAFGDDHMYAQRHPLGVDHGHYTEPPKDQPKRAWYGRLQAHSGEHSPDTWAWWDGVEPDVRKKFAEHADMFPDPEYRARLLHAFDARLAHVRQVREAARMGGQVAA